MFQPFLQRETTFVTSWLCLPPLWRHTHPSIMGLLFKERIRSYRSKFFPLRVDHNETGGKSENETADTSESSPFLLTSI